MKSELLKQCRYYRGETENPYEGKDPDKTMLWFYEMGWVSSWSRGRTDGYNEMINDYVRVGLGRFEPMDGIPVSFKALLFNRYAKTAQSMEDAVEPFKRFFKKYY
ncbi:MAG: hypothetical protein NC038_07695 [Paludibacter sp.]|nr:hypothetical protein [Bacteroidales bacterium]MCM1069952.1 hypothetical protein [Prevotella sp.]MCM1354644.1 hypothetical protein [Bacteroides sp.]MCM1443626.1 hypothetical protein [Muribaculum sp.]MCM1482501.1 hypothetical protein [Paludibacter sp.]